MVLLKASFPENSDGSFFAGERFEIKLTFANDPVPPHLHDNNLVAATKYTRMHLNRTRSFVDVGNRVSESTRESSRERARERSKSRLGIASKQPSQIFNLHKSTSPQLVDSDTIKIKQETTNYHESSDEEDDDAPPLKPASLFSTLRRSASMQSIKSVVSTFSYLMGSVEEEPVDDNIPKERHTTDPLPSRTLRKINTTRLHSPTTPPVMSPTTSPISPQQHSKPPLAPTHTSETTQEVAYAFAQMSGYFSVDGNFIKASSFDLLKGKKMYKTSGVEGGVGGGGSFSGVGNETTSRNLPIYSTAPTLLFHDMKLEPGQSKSYKYEIELPHSLPPSHRGKVIRFSYRLVVGVHKTGVSKPQVFQIPFRLFSKIDGNATKFVYDIMDPSIINKDEAIVVEDKFFEKSSFDKSKKGQGFDVGQDSGSPISQSDLTYNNSSMHNISFICQTAKKVTYDICKNNEPVAQLSLLRSYYKLGESITGILLFPDRSIPCYQVSAFLETNETIDLPYTLKSKHQTQRHTRKIHAEFHKNVLNAKRVNLSLNIPVNASPDFMTSVVNFQYSLRVEFITGTKEKLMQSTIVSGTSLTKPVTTNGDAEGGNDDESNFVHYDGLDVSEVDVFDCVVPLRVFGGRQAIDKLIMFEVV